MKTVFDKSTVAHIWASQSQDCGRTSSDNFSFTGPKLYSYAQPIAYILDREHYVLGEDRKTIVLLNSSSYSMTTNRHQSLARQASRHFRQIYVPGLSENMLYGINRAGLSDAIAAIMEDVKSAASDAARPRIRQATRDAAISRANDRRADALLLIALDKARRLGKPHATKLRALAKLASLDPADFPDPAAYAFALDKDRLIRVFKGSADNARHQISALLEFSADGTRTAGQLLESAKRLDRQIGCVRDNAKAARRAVPRSLVREYAKVSDVSAWRIALIEKRDAEDVAAARTAWNGKLPAMLAALSSDDFLNSEFAVSEFTVTRSLCDADTWAATLAREPGAEERKKIVEQLRARFDDCMIAKNRERVNAMLAEAKTSFDAGEFRRARSQFAAIAATRWADAMDKEHAEKRAQESAARIADQMAAELTAWRAGTLRRLPYDHPAQTADGAALRLSADRECVETSNGAEVPASVCPRLWSAIAAVRASGQDRKFSGFRLGAFHLDRISADGTIFAGCHTIHFAELAMIARQLELPAIAG